MNAPVHASNAQIAARLAAEGKSSARWFLVGDLGKVRHRPDTGTYFLDFRPFGRIYRHRGIPLSDEKSAVRLLEKIRGEVADDPNTLGRVLARYRPPPRGRPDDVPSRYALWLEDKKRERTAGDLSLGYVRELERYAREGGELEWWTGRDLSEIKRPALHDWSLWLANERGLSAKTRYNVLGAFHAFVRWLYEDREELGGIPRFPMPKVAEDLPRVLSIEDQDAILEAIPDDERGIFLACAHLGLRPSEARALDVADLRDGWLSVDKAMDGQSARSPVVPWTKTRRAKRIPIGEALLEWVDRHVDPADRLQRKPLFTNPRTGRRWSHGSLDDRWRNAAKAVGISDVKLYEGTKHTMATDAIRRGVAERALQTFLGHRDLRSTRRYALLGDEALVSVLRARPLSRDPSRVCPAAEDASRKGANPLHNLASPTGVEPVSPP